MPRPANIILTGFMGTGKSTVGRELSRKTGYRLIELDAMIEEAAGMRIAEIFEKHGETGFRERETAELRRASMNRGQIVSTGGGSVIREENREALRSAGPVVCLMASAEAVHERTRSEGQRPLLQTSDPLMRIKGLMAEREQFYREADYMIETEGKTPIEIAEEILEAVGWNA